MRARLLALLFPSIAKVHAETCRERDRLRLENAQLRDENDGLHQQVEHMSSALHQWWDRELQRSRVRGQSREAN